MADVVFIGRRRPAWKILLWSLLTVGIYGRVYLYRTAREIDGHEVLFLDLRIYRILLWLPFLGPLIVKWRLVRLQPRVLRHDPATHPIPAGWLRLASFLPILPLFHTLYQRPLNKHWLFHRKLHEVEHLRARMSVLASDPKSEPEELAHLQEELRRREEELENARRAALAIREARAAERRARLELARTGVKRPRLALPKLNLRRRPKEAPPTEASFGTAETSEPAPEGEPSADINPAAMKKPFPPEPPVEAPIQEPGAGALGEPLAAEASPSRRERRALRKADKERRKQEKREAKHRAKEERKRAKRDAANPATKAETPHRRFFLFRPKSPPPLLAPEPEPVLEVPAPPSIQPTSEPDPASVSAEKTPAPAPKEPESASARRRPKVRAPKSAKARRRQ